MGKAIWKGSISFGLVEIQVGLYPADKTHELALTMLDKKGFSPVGYRRYNKSTQKEVAWEDIVHGYEYEKGEYVVLSDAELRAANPAVTQAVRILHFVDAAEIEPIFYEKPYYLAPLSKKSQGYGLLRETLNRTQTVGIARIAVHTREHIAAVGEREGVLVLYLLRFADEIRSPADLEGARTTAHYQPKELAMAEKLVAGMKERWRPEAFKDEYTRDVMKLVQKKVKSGQVHALPKHEDDEAPAPRKGKIIDLMPLLQKSIEDTRRSESNGRAKASRATRKPTKSARVRRSA